MAEATGFERVTLPLSITDVMSTDILDRLLDSYCFPLRAGLTAYYPKSQPVTIDSIDRIEPADVATRKVFSRLCREFRASGDACEKACLNCDKRIVMKYYQGTWKGAKLYRCHLGLWDMACPLYIRQRLVCVLFGGQLILAGRVGDLKKASGGLANEIEFDPLGREIGRTLSLTEDHVADICAAINGNGGLDDDTKTRLADIAREEAVRNHIGLPDLLRRYREFKEFGGSLGEVVSDFWKLKSEAARAHHIHECSTEVSRKGDELSTRAEDFWAALDRVVEGTLPGVKGYVLYRYDRQEGGYKPDRTWIYDPRAIADHGAFRKACRWVLDRLQEEGGTKDFVTYDLMKETTPASLDGLVRRAFAPNIQIDGWASITGFPLPKRLGRLNGGLICLCARLERLEPWEGDPSAGFFKFYLEALRDVVTILSMVFARHDAEEAQAAAWAVRSHELVAPIHAVKGYQDNLKYAFEVYIEPLLSMENEDIKAIFRARLSRLEGLCDLQELIATAVSLEDAAAEKARFMDFRTDILLPIVQPLRDFAQVEKQVMVYFHPDIRVIPKMYLCINQMKRCVFNLLMNAVKYSDDGSEVRILPQIMRSHYEIRVTNKGIGVPKGEEEHIFGRFIQGSNSGQRVAYGAGLGLYVARRIADFHGGNVVLVNGAPSSTVFALQLPMTLRSNPPARCEKEM